MDKGLHRTTCPTCGDIAYRETYDSTGADGVRRKKSIYRCQRRTLNFSINYRVRECKPVIVDITETEGEPCQTITR